MDRKEVAELTRRLVAEIKDCKPSASLLVWILLFNTCHAANGTDTIEEELTAIRRQLETERSDRAHCSP